MNTKGLCYREQRPHEIQYKNSFRVYTRQLLVAGRLSRTCVRQAGLLAHGSNVRTAFPISQWHIGPELSIYSDEFAQALNLFPYYPVF